MNHLVLSREGSQNWFLNICKTMDDKYPKLNLDKFAHDHSLFYEAFMDLIIKAENDGVLVYLIPKDVYSQYLYSNNKKISNPITGFLIQTYLTGVK